MSREETVEGQVGILVGGGPAPGINAVIAAATTKATSHGLQVVGILEGFKWLARGDASHVRLLGVEDVAEIAFQGGSILRTSRENPTNDESRMQNVIGALRTLGIRYLVAIGGDDTAYSVYRTAECASRTISVVHVPKTIDNDLPLPDDAPTFGFRTATHVGATLVRNLVADAAATGRWYIVVVMGRSAGHVALSVTAGSGASIALIPEELSGCDVSLDLVCDIIEGAVIKGKALGHESGVAVVAEGIAELMKEELRDHPLVIVDNDEHGHFRLSEVPFALILKRALQGRAHARGEKAGFVDVKIGYELRCADPIPFDIEYASQLGAGAVDCLLARGKDGWPETGAMVSIQAGEVVPIPLSGLVDPSTGRTKVRRVDVQSNAYRLARSQMVRLEREDLENERRLAKLSAAAGVSPDLFRARYAHVAGL